MLITPPSCPLSPLQTYRTTPADLRPSTLTSNDRAWPLRLFIGVGNVFAWVGGTYGPIGQLWQVILICQHCPYSNTPILTPAYVAILFVADLVILLSGMHWPLPRAVQGCSVIYDWEGKFKTNFAISHN